MKKVMYGLMAAALSLGLAAPSIAATVPSVNPTSNVVKVQQTTQQPTTKKKTTAKKKSHTKKKSSAKKTPAKKKAG